MVCPAGLIQISFIAVQVINPFEQLTAADRRVIGEQGQSSARFPLHQ